jgi:hypothetical protein
MTNFSRVVPFEFAATKYVCNTGIAPKRFHAVELPAAVNSSASVDEHRTCEDLAFHWQISEQLISFLPHAMQHFRQFFANFFFVNFSSIASVQGFHVRKLNSERNMQRRGWTRRAHRKGCRTRSRRLPPSPP